MNKAEPLAQQVVKMSADILDLIDYAAKLDAVIEGCK